MTRLNLGAADRRIEGFISVDIAPPADQIVDLAGPWPWEDSSVEEVLALDVCEHIHDSAQLRGAKTADRYREDGSIESSGHAKVEWVSGRIHFLNELHRVLKPGARATIETPNAARGVGYFQDPTHVSPFCMSTFKYFEAGAFAHTRLAKSYGITAAFKILAMREIPSSAEGFGEQVWKIHVELEAVK